MLLFVANFPSVSFMKCLHAIDFVVNVIIYILYYIYIDFIVLLIESRISVSMAYICSIVNGVAMVGSSSDILMIIEVGLLLI